MAGRPYERDAVEPGKQLVLARGSVQRAEIKTTAGAAGYFDISSRAVLSMEMELQGPYDTREFENWQRVFGRFGTFIFVEGNADGLATMPTTRKREIVRQVKRLIRLEEDDDAGEDGERRVPGVRKKR